MGHDSGVVQLADDAIAQIPFALAGAAGEEHHVAVIESFLQTRAQGRQIVADDAQRHGLASQFPHGVGQDAGIGVVDHARPHRLARLDDLVARGDDAHSRPPPNGSLADPDGGQHSGLPAGQQFAAAKHGFSGRDVRARVRHSAAGCDGAAHDQLVLLDIRMLHHHHSVGASGQHGAGGDGDGLARFDFAARPDSGGDDFVEQPQPARTLFRRAEGVRGADGEAVDVGAVERGYVDASYDVPGKHSAEGRVDGNELFAQRRQPDRRQESPLGFVSIDHIEKLFLTRHGSIVPEDLDFGPGRKAFAVRGDHDKTVGPRGGAQHRLRRQWPTAQRLQPPP